MKSTTNWFIRKPRPSSPEERAWYKMLHENISYCVLCGSTDIPQVAHRNGAGMALKAHYKDTAMLCAACHYECDNGNVLTLAERRDMMEQAIQTTHDILRMIGVDI